MNILNLFAGIGGNRTLWGDNHYIEAVENNEKIAKIYKKRFPDDIVIIQDSYKYLEDNYNKFDFIWASPPCTTHSKFRYSQPIKILPDMRLYSIIIFLKTWYKGKWVVENVKSYYEPLIKPIKIERHYIWSNFQIKPIKQTKAEIRTNGSIEWICNVKEIDYNYLKNIKIKDKRKIIRNCVKPTIGKYILDYVLKELKEPKKIWEYFEKLKENNDEN